MVSCICIYENFVLNLGQRKYPLIAGSVGPFGACQHDGSEYHGNYVDKLSEEVIFLLKHIYLLCCVTHFAFFSTCQGHRKHSKSGGGTCIQGHPHKKLATF